ncbi:MAG: alpha/beta hydrolase family protein [Acidobacteriota bacterium]
MNERARRTLDAILERVIGGYSIDPGRIHLMGTSMGGGSALAYAIHRPGLARSVCAVIAMTDLARWYAETETYRADLVKALGGSPEEAPEAYAPFSALCNLEETFRQMPLFLTGAEKDDRVFPDHAHLLAERLAAKGYPVIYREAAGAGHSNQAFAPFGAEVARLSRRPDVTIGGSDRQCVAPERLATNVTADRPHARQAPPRWPRPSRNSEPTLLRS